MILITTAGKVGAEAVRLLTQRDEHVRVLVRDRNRATALAHAGADVVEGDLDNAASVDTAMRDVSSVVLVSPAIPTQELTVIDSAVRAKVGHIVKITSKASADSVVRRRRDQYAIERSLIASGLGYTLLRNNAYMQNFLMMASEIATANSFSTGTGDGRIGHIDARDVAAVAAEIAAEPGAHAGKTYWPTGPEVLSAAEVAEVFGKVLDRPITYHPITFEQQRHAMLTAGLPEAVALDNATALSLMAEGDCDYLTDDLPMILGRPARRFERFVIDHAAVFA
ncbi:NmrA family NAD(P)-binding protein [Nocardia vaccinii]|uniref:NmrA family NAD(P)-binding protein n=1 Tax=Nocardia vaccinii TaxID=1822 RepID=UPI000831F68A|nr:NmrA family NAD(P)-binding protein [Nocardia vaccinii]